MRRHAHRLAAVALTATLAGLGIAGTPLDARAATYEELQQQFEESVAAYEQASANVEMLQEEIDENQDKIDKIQQQLPEQRERAAESLRTLYKLQQSQGGLVELILSAEDFNELITTITYLDRIQSKNLSEVQDLADLNAELLEAQDTLNAQKAQADQEAEEALRSQELALQAREEVRLQAIAQAEAERAEAEAALRQAAANAEQGRTFTTASGQSATVTATTQANPAESVSDGSATKQDSSNEQTQPAKTITSERDAFIAKWAPRIDAYLSGSPLGGHGRTFAEAAWDYNVDPRWSPAISCIESSKGAVCFKPCNAWGWGSSSWSDWDSAIRDHVAGLAAGYGYTISTSAAQKYCPPTWQDWYSSVLAEMNSI